MATMYNKHMHDPYVNRSERGAVSIFLVIFFALLIGVITISFIGIVIRDTNQSTNNDLSRSAYDSAEGGIEDAKRAIALYANDCNANGQPHCDAMYNKYFSADNCTAFMGIVSVLHPGVTPDKNGVPVQEGSATNAFNQAYTCVNVTTDTVDYVNNESPYQSDVIPLKSTAQVDGVTLNWFTHADAGSDDNAAFTPRDTCSVTAGASTCALPNEGGWDAGGRKYTPSLLRVQLISYNANGIINEDDLKNNSHTVFLYPSASGVRTADFDTINKTPANGDNAPPIIPVQCGGNDQFACSVTLGLGTNIGKTSFLRITPVYKATTFQVKLTGAGNPLFDGVQPIVDSTGRANDLFRRVQARVRLQNQVLYPEYAVDVDNSLCKDFSVSTDPADFVNTNKCPK